METSTILYLLLGLALLLGSGKYLVESSVTIARHFRIPTSIIGLTIVAFGTSAPELLVSVQAAVHGHPDMALGNVVGSNISNILLVLALTTIIFPLAVKRKSILRDWPVMMALSLLLFLFLLDLKLSRLEGGVFALLLVSYIVYSVKQSRLPANADAELSGLTDENKWWIAVLIFLLSCVGLAYGADLLVTNASEMAAHFGISERVISITMVALGTSLPELATSLIAAFKKEAEISIGNILGSNVMNIISVLSITALIKPINTVPEALRVDMPWMIGAALLLFLFMLPVSKGKISRIEGSVMLLGYASYIYFIFMT